MKSFDQQAADWARTKPADMSYDYGSNSNCALCQFLRENGFSDNPRVAGYYWTDGIMGPMNELTLKLQRALVRLPHTFGALTGRLSA